NTTSYLAINYENTGTTLLNGRILFVLDDSTTLVISYPTPDIISGDSLYYNFTNLWPFSINQIQVELLLPGAGTVLHFAAYAEYDSSGTYYLADGSEITETVTCSYDPNNKSVLPEGLFAEHRTLYTDTLLYTIRFQNTGNDTAFVVYVRDLIDPSLDLSTLHMTGSSHPMSTTIYPNRMVEFKFENILLPDSNIDEPGSHGFVQYKIRPRTNLALPVVVNNEANIYFDSNFPVLTNTVSNTLVSDLNVGISSAEDLKEITRVVPNPFRGEAEIILGESFKDSESELRVMNLCGALLFSKKTNSLSVKISGDKLANGIYFYEVRSNNGKRSMGKFVIE
ncbi:MAG: T9SS type A sorting domain-containing protein, partial [Bacteroidota bacterium]